MFKYLPAPSPDRSMRETRDTPSFQDLGLPAPICARRRLIARAMVLLYIILTVPTFYLPLDQAVKECHHSRIFLGVSDN